MENSSLGREVMAKELYNAVLNGNNEVINTNIHSEKYLLAKTHHGKNNIVHIAIRSKQLGFAEAALQEFPQLLCEGNFDKNNPLHIAAEVGNTDFVRRQCQQLTDDMRPLTMKNSNGNTPLHVALIYGHLDIASLFLEKDHSLAAVVNDDMEVPLHLLIKHYAAKENWGVSNIVPSQEEFLTLTTLLLEKNSSVACWRDTSSSTPLHLATRLNTAYNLIVIDSILWHCPMCAEVCDNFGKSILHHLVNRISRGKEGFRLLEKNRGLYALINHQDQQGDTPLHMAVINKDYILVRLLLDAKANVNLKNKAGLSASALNQQNKGDMENPWREPTMSKDLYVAATNNNTQFIKDIQCKEDLLRKTHDQNNVVHIAIKHGNYSFAKVALWKFPHLLLEKNSDGNTPFHIAAQTKDAEFMRKLCEKLKDKSRLRMQNSKGNTPLHVALIYNKLQTACILMEQDPYLISIVNDSKETPLHLVFRVYEDSSTYDTGKINPLKENVINLLRRVPPFLCSSTKTFVSSTPDGMLDIMRRVLEKESDIACWKDASGMTPLHRAALLNTSYNLDVIKAILYYCPQSAEVSDNCGKTVLHHLINRIKNSTESQDFLEDSKILALMNHQDQQGNTPLHMAIINKDIIMYRLLWDIYQLMNPYILNNDGLSTIDLIRQSDIEFHSVMKTLTEEECDVVERGELFLLSQFVIKRGRTFLYSLDPEGRTVVHKLFSLKRLKSSPGEFLNFMDDSFPRNFGEVLNKTDRNGNTPFHLLAQLDPQNIADVYMPELRNCSIHTKVEPYHPQFYLNHVADVKRFLKSPFLRNLTKACYLGLRHGYDDETFDSPWLKQNNKGNTPLHDAILAKNYPVFVEFAPYSKINALTNNHNETVLHLLASLTSIPSIEEDVMNDIIKKNLRDPEHHLDKDGLSPLLRAIQANNIEFAKRLCSHCPELAELADREGQTLWHLFVNLPKSSINLVPDSFKQDVVWSQLEKKNNDENSPLHLAIKFLRFDVAMVFLGNDKFKYRQTLLEIPNKEGDTPGNMIGALPYLPPEFEKFLWENSMMIGTRSMWGIPTTQMKEYVNTMGVIAALLTTITFTAAFTVPGGLNQEKGNPLLMNNPAFQVFIISDVLAMCLSMLVLFCLLWIMATGNKSKSVVLLDFSIILLLASFYTTLLTFMAGVYATTYNAKLWVAIVSLVPCCMLLLLMHRKMVMNLVIPSGKGILTFANKVYHFHFPSKALGYAWKPFHYANELRKKIISRIQKCGARSSSSSAQLPLSSVEAN